MNRLAGLHVGHELAAAGVLVAGLFHDGPDGGRQLRRRGGACAGAALAVAEPIASSAGRREPAA